MQNNEEEEEEARRTDKNGREIGTGKASRFPPQRYFPFPLISIFPISFRSSANSIVDLGQKVFEWDQTLEEVDIYINLPPNVHSKLFYCKIQSKHIELGIKGNPPFLNVTLISFPFDYLPYFIIIISHEFIIYVLFNFSA